MVQTPTCNSVFEAARLMLAKSALARPGYVIAIADGTMSLEGFRRSQSQFYFAVEYYARPMATLLGRIPRAGDRLEILRNLVDEHGEMKPDAFHATTFQRFLQSLGVDRTQLDGSRPGPVVHAFNVSLAGVCSQEPLGVGLGCLGMIELAFAGISSAIGSAVLSRNWIRHDQLVHYGLHAELDIQHARDFFRTAEPYWTVAEGHADVTGGLELGRHVFEQLYAGLLGEAR